VKHDGRVVGRAGHHLWVRAPPGRRWPRSLRTVGDEERREPQEGEPGGPPTLGNAVYRWADRILGPLPYGVRVTIVGAIIAALVVLPIVAFVVLLSRA
jgi:hypothetical protein